MEKVKKNCAKTLLMSVIFGLPCPIIVGVGLLFGQSSTQIADFFRLLTELLGIIMAYVVFVMTNKAGACDEAKKAMLEKMSSIFVGIVMCIGGIIMLVVSIAIHDSEKGNVIPGLVISFVGAVMNIIFWRKYVSLSKKSNNDIVAVQTRMYSAKSLVNICVTLALLAVALFPGTDFSFYFDLVGSFAVALYVIFCGGKTLFEKLSVSKKAT